MTSYTIKWLNGERVIYEGSRRLSPKEMREYDRERDEKNSHLNMKCPECGKHSTSKAKKNGEPRKKNCPECGTEMERNFRLLAKKDSSQVRRKVERYNHYGMDKDQAHQFYDSSIKGIKKRIEGVGGASHYKAMIPDMDYMVKTGQAKPMSTEEIQSAQKARKEMVVKHAKKINPKRSNNSQSSK